MARPSVKEERAEMILNAFEVCVAKYGVEGAALQKIADEAGLARALLRHHIGNREELVEALANRFIERSRMKMQELSDYLPQEAPMDKLIDWLFADEATNSVNDVLITEALIAAAQSRPWLKDQLKDWFEETEKAFADLFARQYPDMDKERLHIASTGFIGIYFNADSFSPLGDVKPIRRRSKAAAMMLLKGLEQIAL